MSNNIFEIWDSIGRKTPFAVRRVNWTEEYYTVVEKIDCTSLPYGNAFGYPTINGKYSDHYDYDKKWRKDKLIPCCGCYQWTLVENADLTNLKEGLAATKKYTQQELKERQAANETWKGIKLRHNEKDIPAEWNKYVNWLKTKEISEPRVSVISL